MGNRVVPTFLAAFFPVNWPEMATFVGIPIDPVLILSYPELVNSIVREVDVTSSEKKYLAANIFEFANCDRNLKYQL